MCALAVPTTRAKRICKRHSGLHFRRNQGPHSTICPTSAIQHPQNHSGADRNPIGRSPRPSQTPATHFKRPYRNCPGEENCAQSRLIGQGSPDRDLSFVGTNPENAANFLYFPPLGRNPSDCRRQTSQMATSGPRRHYLRLISTQRPGDRSSDTCVSRSGTYFLPKIFFWRSGPNSLKSSSIMLKGRDQATRENVSSTPRLPSG